MTLYHYTSLDSFLSIWKSKTLRFSYSKNTNDFFEREKVCRITTNSIVHNGQRLDEHLIRNFQLEIFDEIDKYKQISFSTDYPDGIPGYASPMMWGQYARKQIKEGSYQDGVCIELESEKLVRPQFCFYEGQVTYTDSLKSPIVEGEDIAKPNAAEYFIDKVFPCTVPDDLPQLVIGVHEINREKVLRHSIFDAFFHQGKAFIR